jgi:hypothetical protein
LKLLSIMFFWNIHAILTIDAHWKYVTIENLR